MSFNLKTIASAAILTLATTSFMSVASAPANAHQPGWKHSHWHGHHGHSNWKKRRHWRRHHQHRSNRVVVQRGNVGGGGGISSTFGGQIIGAILGGAIGTQVGKGSGRTAAIIGGAVVGAILGGRVGQQMEAADRRRSQTVLETAPTGRSVNWKNPDTGAQYKVTPTKTYRTASGQACRDYTTWVFIDGYEEQVHGTACRTADGRWVPTNG